MADTLRGRVGLIGDPVEHSLSPAFQQPAFDALGWGIRYELWPTTVIEIPTRLAMLRSGEAFGANVTVPHKQAFHDAVDTRSDEAARAGAVNTVIARDGALHGENTDIHGFIVPLRERGFDFLNARVVVVGAGGAARGVLVALLDAGVPRITLANRTLARAEQAAGTLDSARIATTGLDDLAAVLDGATLIVNATSTGWQRADPIVSAEALVATAHGAIAYDLTYRETAFLRLAASLGLACLDGLEMLVHQGARSFELWTGTPAPLELMLSSARDARVARGG